MLSYSRLDACLIQLFYTRYYALGVSNGRKYGDKQLEQTHCLMMNGKLYGHTKEDALAFAKDNGVRKPENIINEVASAISLFRIFAKKHLVEERWISAAETRLNELLASWGFVDTSKDVVNIEIGDVLYENVRIEQTYKGNYHLYATINDKER